MFKRGGGIFWEGGVDSGSVAYRSKMFKNWCIFWEGYNLGEL